MANAAIHPYFIDQLLMTWLTAVAKYANGTWTAIETQYNSQNCKIEEDFFCNKLLAASQKFSKNSDVEKQTHSKIKSIWYFQKQISEFAVSVPIIFFVVIILERSLYHKVISFIFAKKNFYNKYLAKPGQCFRQNSAL